MRDVAIERRQLQYTEGASTSLEVIGATVTSVAVTRLLVASILLACISVV